jgi:hypothetical protein
LGAKITVNPTPKKAQNPHLFIGVFFGAKVVQKRGRLNETGGGRGPSAKVSKMGVFSIIMYGLAD